MAGRPSNRDRIAQAAQEADAARAQREKAAAHKKEPLGTQAKKKSASKKATGRVRNIWAVCDRTGETVERFPYPQQAEAKAEAERLTAETGQTHFVKPDQVSM